MLHEFNMSNYTDGIDVGRLMLEIHAASLSASIVKFSDDLSKLQIESEDTLASIQAIVDLHDGPNSLAIYKKNKFIQIDGRTEELIASGFQYAGKTFSLSMNAQAKMMGINQIRSENEVVYPIRWNTKDDNDYYEIQNANDMRAFYLTGVGTYRAHVDAGTALKDLVRAATSKAEVDAVVDPR